MAAADTARLIAQLTLDDKGFTKGLSNAERKLGKFEGTAFRVGQHIGSGAKATIANVAKIGVAATVGIAGAVKIGLDNLAQLESAITSVDGAIAQMGLTGQITGKQVAGWANDIERDIGAAFDDKEITQAASTLIRFGKVTPKNLKPALAVIADLAVKTGDVESASELLAKALADPAKAAGKLARQGIILTKAQQDQIKAMLEVNDVAGAQQLILDEVAKTTAGAAAASAGPYQRSLNILKDVFEDTTKALAIGFLPVITKVSDLLGKELAKPETLANIQKFGEGLASGLDDLIEVARNLPWATIGESLKLGAAGATAILKAFTQLPPWVQTAVLTGWGLNKLTGGALGGIVGELGKGLIKGVLGINAGIVNVNGPVAGVGGAAGAAGAAGGAGKAAGLVKAATNVFLVGLAAGVGFELANAIGDATGTNVPDDPFVAIDALFDTYIPPILGEEKKTNAHLQDQKAKSQQNAFAIRDATRQGAEVNRQAAFAIRDKVAGVGSLTVGAINAVKSVASQTTAAARAAGQQAAFAIRDKDLSVSVANSVHVNTSVSVRETSKTQTTYKQFSRFIS